MKIARGTCREALTRLLHPAQVVLWVGMTYIVLWFLILNIDVIIGIVVGVSQTYYKSNPHISYLAHDRLRLVTEEVKYNESQGLDGGTDFSEASIRDPKSGSNTPAIIPRGSKMSSFANSNQHQSIDDHGSNKEHLRSDYLNKKSSMRKVTTTKATGSLRVMPTVYLSIAERKNLKLLQRLSVIESATPEVTLDTKVILWYIPTRYHPVLSRLHRLRTCPNVNCRVTTNRYFYNQSDALIFTAQLVPTVRIPPRKLPNQVWILHNHESPRYWASALPLYQKVWKNKFNWTMDYRSDADVLTPYGCFAKDSDGNFKREIPSQKNYSEIMSTKTGSVAWMVSNCKVMSQRMEYVEALRKHGVKVDILGHCGLIRCGRADDNTCLAEISKHYKFYLAFENAFCKDYITEKFFRYFKADLLVIVRGGGDYSTVAPHGTYIDTAAFSTAVELAAYINKLDRNDAEYIAQLKLKDIYNVVYEDWPVVMNGAVQYTEYHYDAKPMCDICARLWNANTYRKSYDDIGSWLRTGMCYNPTDLGTRAQELIQKYIASVAPTEDRRLFANETS